MAVVLALLATTPACGGAAAGSSAKTTDTPPNSQGSTRTYEDAETELDAAEDRLYALLGEGPSGDSAGLTPQVSEPPGPQPTAPQPGPEPEAAGASEDPCLRACEALKSMERSAERLCELSGADDSRCERAQQRVVRAADRVASSCSACAEEEP